MANLQKRSRVDRISDLPDSLICYILSFLPTESAVATSTLGRRWKFLWTNVTVLDFENEEDDDADSRPNNERMNFVQFVNKVFIQHESKLLEKFRLSWNPVEICDAVYVNEWISYAIARKVRVLDLGLNNVEEDESVIQVPSTLFTCVSLEFLRLDGLICIYVPSVVCLPKLEVLILSLYGFGWDKCVQKLVSSCPVLDSLEIIRGDHATMPSFKISSLSLRRLEMEVSGYLVDLPYEGKVEIDAPNLKCLYVHDYILDEFSVKWLPSVDTVELDLYTHHADHYNYYVKVIEALTHVKFLTLYGSIMKALSNATIPLSVCFERLTKLDVHCNCCHWSSLNLMLDYSIRLKVLNIAMIPCEEDTHKECWKDPKQVPKCLLRSLTHISFKGFMGFKDQMTMMNYILKHGRVLKSIIVQSGACGCYGNLEFPCDVNRKFEMLQKIATFPRWSRFCEIKFD